MCTPLNMFNGVQHVQRGASHNEHPQDVEVGKSVAHGSVACAQAAGTYFDRAFTTAPFSHSDLIGKTGMLLYSDLFHVVPCPPAYVMQAELARLKAKHPE